MILAEYLGGLIVNAINDAGTLDKSLPGKAVPGGGNIGDAPAASLGYDQPGKAGDERWDDRLRKGSDGW